MKSFAEIDIENNGDYLKLLSAVSKLSGLFSDNSIPLINYRVAENIFCRSFDAGNLSRSDTAFDADYNSLGIGLKTFTCPSTNSNEKIAEFNSLSSELKELKGKSLAVQLSEYRNERIDLAKRTYKITDSIYHIVARKENELILFETDYDFIDIDNIHNQKKTKAGWSFEDGKNSYSFNYSKSTLYRKFIIPEKAYRLPISIIEDPYSLLLEVFKDKVLPLISDGLKRGVNFVILPLYSTRYKDKRISEKSGLNQWNAGGRERNISEIYIPIPIEIHKQFPDFFPDRDEPFKLKVPSGEVYDAKVCQDNSKALMTNPNKDLSNWLLRNVLKLKDGELATMDKLDKLGLDSVILIKDNEGLFKIDIMKTDSYINFMGDK